MSNTQDNRVLSRKGARLLGEDELDAIYGNGVVTTDSCTFNPLTGSRDGDCD
jgi:hypothetical protein